MILDEICAEIHNYFTLKDDILIDDYEISDGRISAPVLDGQYYRIVGSVFNDGVHSSGDVLTDEPEFHGAVWLMRVPQTILDLAEEIGDWQDKYDTLDNQSPFISESFGGYSYTKASGGNSDDTTGGTSWQSQSSFMTRLNPYRRIRTI